MNISLARKHVLVYCQIYDKQKWSYVEVNPKKLYIMIIITLEKKHIWRIFNREGLLSNWRTGQNESDRKI